MIGKGALQMERKGDGTKLTFYLEIKAGGLIEPMVRAVMSPVLKPIAEDFAVKLKARTDGLQSQGPGVP